MLKLKMELLLMILFLLCTDATNVTEVKVKLGQNAILTCSVNISNMYWYLEIHSQLRGYILRTFGATDNKPLYCAPEFKTKYSVQNNSLVVKNVTAEDCRLYFCGGKKSGIIHFEETIQLVSDVPISLSTNESEPNNQQKQLIQTIWQHEFIVFSSLALNVVLMIITGFFFTSMCLKRQKSKLQMIEPSPLTSESPMTLEIPQYEEIQLRVPPPAAECIYYKAQLPRSTLTAPNHLDIS